MMSINNVWLSSQSALVGVDTAVGERAGISGEMSKLLPLVHLNAVLTGRGHMHFLCTLFTVLQWCNADSVDALLEAMPEILPQTFAQWVRSGVTADATDAELDAQSVVLVGWSKRESRPIGCEFSQASRSAGWSRDTISPHHIAPWDASLSYLPDPVNVPAMATLARAQCELVRDKDPGCATSTGGRLLVAHITARGMSLASVCELN